MHDSLTANERLLPVGLRGHQSSVVRARSVKKDATATNAATQNNVLALEQHLKISLIACFRDTAYKFLDYRFL